MSDWFNSKKAAQVAAFFCGKQGGEIPVLKLVKLIYLADREFLAECGFPITNDLHFSMKHGPVNSETYNYITGVEESDEWDSLISDRANHNVSLARALADEDLDELSDAEIDAMTAVWARFGQMTKYEIRDWTHANCPEWEKPYGGGSIPIPLARTLSHLGFDKPEQFSKRSDAFREFKSAVSELKENGAGIAW